MTKDELKKRTLLRISEYKRELFSKPFDFYYFVPYWLDIPTYLPLGTLERSDIDGKK